MMCRRALGPLRPQGRRGGLVVARRAFSEAAEAAAPTAAGRASTWARRVVRFAAIGAGVKVAWMGITSKRRKQILEEKISSGTERPFPTRPESMARLRGGEAFDVLVVGGGATGAGVALEAQLRGLSVCLVEQEDFASGTSSKSTQLIWAGSRYLVKGLVQLLSPSSLWSPVTAWEQFRSSWRLVMGCFRERRYMLEMNPHLTHWMPIAVPFVDWVIWPPPFDFPPAAVGPVTGLFVIFFKIYDLLGSFSAPNSYIMSAARAKEEFAQMDTKRLKYITVFYEGAHNDARTNLCIAFTAASHGACIANYAQVTRMLFDEHGMACGAEILDRAEPDATPFEVKAKSVVFAGGPFTDGLRRLSEGEETRPVVNGSGGTHIVLPPYYCPRHIGMVDMMTSRGSYLFFLPWEGYTLVGTTDVKTTPLLHHEVPEDEIQYLINECEKYLSPDLHVRRRDVMSAWYGIRPLAFDPNAKDQSSASRDHIVSHNPTNGITFVSGGKWTTWREMAQDTVDTLLRKDKELRRKAGPSISFDTPLVGCGKTKFFPAGYHENMAVRLSQEFDLAYDVAQHLVRNYGTRAAEVLSYVEPESIKGSRSGLYKHYPRLYEGAAATTGYPYLEAEVRYAVEREYAVSPADILARRTRLAFLNSTAAKLTLPRVVNIMGDLLGWDLPRRQLEHEKAEAVLSADFAGPAPNKQHAGMRTACTADVKYAFDKIDTRQRGYLKPDGIEAAAQELGFPLAEGELKRAMAEMDLEGRGEVSFPQFLAWWNSSEESNAIKEELDELMRKRSGAF